MDARAGDALPAGDSAALLAGGRGAGVGGGKAGAGRGWRGGGRPRGRVGWRLGGRPGALSPFSWPFHHFPCRKSGQKPQLLTSTGERAGKVVKGPRYKPPPAWGAAPRCGRGQRGPG